MIRIIAITKNLNVIHDLPIYDLLKENILWYWMDFNNPSEQETSLLNTYFHFHSLAIEDCVLSLNSPKLDYYDNYNFFILNALTKNTLDPVEISLFVGTKYIVSYHSTNSNELDKVFELSKTDNQNLNKGPSYIAHQILDEIVDSFFPVINKIENKLDEIENNIKRKTIRTLMDEIFDMRSDLLKLRRLVNSMRDLLYIILNSEHLIGFHEHKFYFSDIHDHLVKLSSMVDSNREMTSDMRDNYLSVNSTRMNRHMMVLTVISSIFIPLTFIVGVYGMNFSYMPELTFKYGYFIILLIMAIIAIEMFLWFKRRGWFDV
ncbi:magnesium/cobalt transporter CorA [Clostridium sp.]|uniref:magnesium/cobalt transporter CorA n=1 Tax=Clostridium sp. TaxID=1506 RepID=UPI003EEDD74F